MHKTTVTVTVDVGLHARPASQFVQSAKRMQSEIHLQHGEKIANAKSIIQVLSLGVNQFDELEITAEGPDEVEAIQTLSTLIKKDFAE
ncbi:MAG: HPr family phosphocarrier protein [Anaerolineae bacterium]|nr:HPr family phosphocarrier protein [Anaerolineae bacterium]